MSGTFGTAGAVAVAVISLAACAAPPPAPAAPPRSPAPVGELQQVAAAPAAKGGSAGSAAEATAPSGATAARPPAPRPATARPAARPAAVRPAAAPRPALGAAPAAPARRSRLDFAPYTASLLGGTAAAEHATAVAVAPDGTIVVGGALRSVPGRRGVAVAGGGPGTVVRLDRTGRRVLSVTRVPGTVDDLDVARAGGSIAVTGTAGVLVLDRTARRALWRRAGCAGGGADTSSGRRVAVADDGTVATLCGRRVRAFSRRGAALGAFAVRHGSVDDVAVSSRTRLVYTTGGDNLGNLRVPFVQASTYRGGARWKAWGWNRAQVGGDTSDSFGKRVAVGGDGRLYLLGEAHGGVTVFRRDGRSPRRNAPNVARDAFTTTSNTGSNALLYVARLDARTGRHLAGQLLLTRKRDGKGNSLSGHAIAADERGRIVVAGAAAAYVQNRDARTVCGRRLPPYGGDVFVLQLAPDLRSRPLWTALGGTGSAGGVAVRGGVAVAVLDATSRGAVTCRRLAGTPSTARTASAARPDAYLTTWSAARP